MELDFMRSRAALAEANARAQEAYLRSLTPERAAAILEDLLVSGAELLAAAGHPAPPNPLRESALGLLLRDDWHD